MSSINGGRSTAVFGRGPQGSPSPFSPSASSVGSGGAADSQSETESDLPGPSSASLSMFLKTLPIPKGEASLVLRGSSANSYKGLVSKFDQNAVEFFVVLRKMKWMLMIKEGPREWVQVRTAMIFALTDASIENVSSTYIDRLIIIILNLNIWLLMILFH